MENRCSEETLHGWRCRPGAGPGVNDEGADGETTMPPAQDGAVADAAGPAHEDDSLSPSSIRVTVTSIDPVLFG